MHEFTPNKIAALKRLSDENGIIGALAIDQRGSLKKLIGQASKESLGNRGLVDFKNIVSQELTKYASAILLDPEYGLEAATRRNTGTGLLLAYEKTGYDAATPGRLPDALDDWSVKRLKEAGADAVKFLLYYDVDEDPKINHRKHVFMERVGSECASEDIPFFLELISYDAQIADSKSFEYAKLKPKKVIGTMREFSKPRYQVDVLKVEVPVNMKYVEGYADGNFIFTREEAKKLFKEQSQATHLPYIFLSGGVSAEVFYQTLRLASEAGADFNGVLCGRATWKNGIVPFATQGEEAGAAWMQTEGRGNILALNEVLRQTAKPWFKKAGLSK